MDLEGYHLGDREKVCVEVEARPGAEAGNALGVRDLAKRRYYRIDLTSPERVDLPERRLRSRRTPSLRTAPREIAMDG